MRYVTVYLYDAHQMHDSKYQAVELELETTERMQEDYFRTLWLEINKRDLQLYSDYVPYVHYCKVFLEETLKIYEGKPLQPEELQCMIKHQTRIDEPI